MTKSELIALLGRDNPQWLPEDIEKSMDVIMAAMTDALEEDRRAEFRGFGSFTCRRRRAQAARNPRTGTIVQVEARRHPTFRASPALLKDLNE